MTKTAALLVALLLPASTRAIELALEENRGERGSVGYVDMQRLFADSPDAHRAKESFADLVRQAEERVNLRRAELLKLGRELDAARIERDMLAKSMAPASVAASTTAAQSAAIPVASSTAAAAAADTTPAKRLLELDAQVIAVQADIARKESELAREHDDADHGLLDVESHKTDQVLARLYRAVSAVARREGVSVVVDKTTILYGHPAVDLTDKVLEYLKKDAAP